MDFNELKKEMGKYFRLYISEFVKSPQDEEKLKLEGKQLIRCFLPDHEDKNPSMTVFEDKAYCFKDGTIDIFRAAHLLEGKPLNGKDFMSENVFYLADKLNIDLSSFNKNMSEEIAEKMRLRYFFGAFYDYIRQGLEYEDERTFEYLKRRQISKPIAKSLGIGTVKSFKDFSTFMKKRGFDVYDYEKIGIHEKNINENKLIFIIKDEYDQPCSFACREMVYEETVSRETLRKYLPHDTVSNSTKKGLQELAFKVKDITKEERIYITKASDIPKYVNGTETIVYKKKDLLYNYKLAKEAIEKYRLQYIYAVEGYTDVVSAIVQKNFNVVSYNSSTLSDGHIKLLKKTKAKKAVFVADNDAVGKTKILDLIERAKAQNLSFLKIGIFKNKKLKDLDEQSRANPNVKTEDLLEIYDIFEYQAKLLIEEQIEAKNLDLTAIITEVCMSIGTLVSPAERFTAGRTFYELIQSYSIEDNYWDLKTILAQIEFAHDNDKESLSRDLVKDILDAKAMVEKDPYNAITILENTIFKAKEKNKKMKNENKDSKDMCLESLEEYDEKKKEKKEPMYFGFPFLNNLYMKKLSNIVLLAKPNSGKTILQINISHSVLKNSQDTSVIYFSRDDSFETVMDGFIALEAKTTRKFAEDPYYDEKTGIYNSGLQEAKDKERAYKTAKDRIKKWIKEDRLLIFGLENGLSTLADFEKVLKDHSATPFGQNSTKIIFVDSSSKISSGQAGVKEMAVVSRSVKSLALSYGYHAFQNYEVTKQGQLKGHRVEMSHLADAKEIEFDADLIIRLTQPVHDLNSSGHDIANSTWDKKLANGSSVRLPVVVADFTKNKVSSHKNESYYLLLDGTYGTLKEITKDNDLDQYKALNTAFRNDLANNYGKLDRKK